MLAAYRSLELRVEVLMSAACTPFCKVCPTPCCRTAICREAAESPFLLAVHGSRQTFDAKSGYLGATGCKLGAGRPPVCHAFICGRILSEQKSDHRRFALECLGDLIGYLGKRVWLKRLLKPAWPKPVRAFSNPGWTRGRGPWTSSRLTSTASGTCAPMRSPCCRSSGSRRSTSDPRHATASRGTMSATGNRPVNSAVRRS